MPQNRHYANRCPEIKANDTKGPHNVQNMDEGITKNEAKTKSIRPIGVQFSNLEMKTKDPFMRYWVILSNLGWSALMRDILQKYSWIQGLMETLSRENFIKYWLFKV